MEYLKGQKEEEAIKWMDKAAEVAGMALCLKAKCGTVIVKDNEIIGKGYNAPPLDKEENRVCDKESGPGKPNYDQTCCMHAEWRAIMDALRTNPEKIKGSKLYFTRVDEKGEIKKSGKPYCTVCSRLALDAGIDYFLLWHDEGVCEYKTDEYDRLSRQYTSTNMIKLGKYKHFKGKEYEVVGVAKHSETMEDLVVYRALYDEGSLWVRPLKMFLEEVEVNGKKVPRFSFIG